MKTHLTLFILIFSFLALNAQEDIIRNGDFELNDGAGTISGVDDWHMDKETPGSGLGGDVGSRHIFLASDDSAGFYQVVDVVSADSMIYELGFYAFNSWQGDSLMVTFSTSDVDSAVRTPYLVDTVITSDGNHLVSMAIPPSSAIEGKKLIVEFQVVGVTDGWTHISALSLIRKSPWQNSPPVADAGLAQTVVGKSSVTLDGSASYDTDDDPLTYLWKSQYPGIILSDPTAEQPTFTAPDITEISVYNFSLLVNDGTINSDTAYTQVTVTPAGELIRNGDFKDREATWESSNSLKDIHNWNMDAEALDLTGGIWDLEMIHITNVDPTIYQIVDEISTDTSIYTLTFSAKTSWYGKGITSIFSVSDADSSVRTQIESQENDFTIDPAGGTTSSEFEVYKHVIIINANSPNAGKKLILELQATHFDNTDDVDTSWTQIELVSLVKETREGGGPIDAVRSNQIDNGLILYPNPANNVVHINSDSDVVSAQIYSLDGKMVKAFEGSDFNHLDISELTAGIYIVRIKTLNEFQQVKLQVTK